MVSSLKGHVKIFGKKLMLHFDAFAVYHFDIPDGALKNFIFITVALLVIF